MAKSSNIVHQYFKKQVEDTIILVKVNPLFFKGTEITILKNGELELRELDFDEQIFEDLAADGFQESSPLEFNLYHSGLA
jgi:nitrogen fixation protein